MNRKCAFCLILFLVHNEHELQITIYIWLMSLQERRAAVDEAGKASDDFYRLFYKTLEMRPHVVN